MKRVYWRPKKISRTILAILTVISLAGLGLVENKKTVKKQPYFKQKIRASRLASRAMDQIKSARASIPIPPDQKALSIEMDTANTGLIGLDMSPVTSNTGHLPAKRTSINPNFAAVIVHLLKKAGVKEGDRVAVGFSGSFPAVNICTLSAIQTLKLRPTIVSSAAASQWGANVPNLLWIDMERLLFESNLFAHRSFAASRGGGKDRALGMTRAGRELLDETIARNELVPIKGKKTIEDAVDDRMTRYHEKLNDNEEYVAYINVGGGWASVGSWVGKKMFKPGLNMRPVANRVRYPSVMLAFSELGTPVINLSQIVSLAQKYGLPIEPEQKPRIGEGNIFYRESYNQWLAGGLLLLVLVLLFFFIRTDVGFRILQTSGTQKKDAQPEQMI